MTFDDPKNLESLIPENLRESDLFVIVSDMIQTARTDLADKLILLENLTNPDKETEDVKFLLSMLGDSLVKSGFKNISSLEELFMISRILYTWKGTIRALQFAFDSFGVPFNIFDPSEVNEDLPAFGLNDPLSCEILLRSKPEEDLVITDAHYAQAWKAMDFFLWMCIDPIFIIQVLCDDTLILSDSSFLTTEMDFENGLYQSRQLSFATTPPPEGTFIPNKIGSVTFSTFEGTEEEGGELTIDGDFPVLENLFNIEGTSFYNITFEFYNDENKILFSKGDDVEPSFIYYIEDKRLKARIWSDPGTYADFTSTTPISEGWNSCIFSQTLTEVFLNGYLFDGTFYISGGGDFILGGSVITHSLTENPVTFRRIALATSNGALLDSGLLGFDSDDDFTFSESLPSQVEIFETTVSGTWFEPDVSDDGDDYYITPWTPEDADDSEFELDGDDLTPLAVGSGTDLMFEEDGGDLQITNYVTPPLVEQTFTCDAFEYGELDFADNYPALSGNAWDAEETGWITPTDPLTVLADDLFEEDGTGDLVLKESAFDDCELWLP